ncbi:MAG: hypothetical protein HZC43_02275 [Nitrosomonadales bacterium]|nr:hypothetical protein [Nitrosomonadales bacterium]
MRGNQKRGEAATYIQKKVRACARQCSASFMLMVCGSWHESFAFVLGGTELRRDAELSLECCAVMQNKGPREARQRVGQFHPPGAINNAFDLRRR